MKKYTLILALLVSLETWAQESPNQEENFKSHHSVALLLGHTHLRKGASGNDTKWLSLPSIGLDYNYHFNPEWSIGLHNDIITENFAVEKTEGNEVIERTKPIASLLTVGYKPGEHFTYQFGLGGEFAKEENFFVTRIGIEYSLELPKEFELLGNFGYDLKWKGYDSFAIGIGIAKIF